MLLQAYRFFLLQRFPTYRSSLKVSAPVPRTFLLFPVVLLTLQPFLIHFLPNTSSAEEIQAILHRVVFLPSTVLFEFFPDYLTLLQSERDTHLHLLPVVNGQSVLPSLLPVKIPEQNLFSDIYSLPQI